MVRSTHLWSWQIEHWAARVIAAALALLIIVLLIGEGGPNPRGNAGPIFSDGLQ